MSNIIIENCELEYEVEYENCERENDYKNDCENDYGNHCENDYDINFHCESENQSSILIEENLLDTMDTDIETETETEYSTSDESISFYDKISNSETDDLTNSIHELIKEYLCSEILKISKIDFHKEMCEDITHILFQTLQDAEICKDCDYDSLYDIVEFHCDLWFETGGHNNYPCRTIQHHMFNAHCREYGLNEDMTVHYLTERIDYLRKVNENSPKQRTPEWYQRRYNMMTASNLWQALNTESQRNRLIYEKCKPLDFGYTESKWINTDNSLHWGVKYEPLSIMVYENITNTKVEEFGCIQHEKYPFIGASPDGIITNKESPLYGRMLEIKNIYNREMNGIPSEAYWIQTQIQMECCQLDVCDFVETRFKEYENENAFWEESDHDRLRGIILHFIPKDGRSNVPIYKYMPLNIGLNHAAIDDWVLKTKSELNEYNVFKKIFWYLDAIFMSTVLRNTAWFDNALPIIKETWVTIEKERVSGYQHRAAKKRAHNINDVIVINSDDGTQSQLIQNMPLHGGISIIKLESIDEESDISQDFGI